MKKTVALLSVFAVLALCLGITYADSVCTVNITADATELRTGSTFVMNISLDNVTAEGGLCLAQFTLKYDPALFSVEKVESIYPSSWKNTDGLEDWSTALTESDYLLCVMNSEPGHGAKSGELGFKVTLKALSDKANGAKIRLYDICISDDTLNNYMDIDDVSFTVNYGKPVDDVSISENPPVNSEPEPEDPPVIDPDPVSEAVDISDGESEVIESEVSSDVTHAEDGKTSADTDVSEDRGDNAANTVVYIVIGLIILAVIGIAAAMMLKKKNGKDIK